MQDEMPQRIDPLRAVAAEAAAGDGEAVHSLLVSVTPAMRRVVGAVLGPGHREIDDVLQEAALGLLRALPKFRYECTVLHFACRVAMFAALSARRRAQRRAEHSPQISIEAQVATCPGPDELTWA